MPDQPVKLREPGGPQGGMLCPQCGVDLVMSDRQGIEIDYCPKCRGVWLDRGELDKIIERSLGPAPSAPPPARPEAAPPVQYRRDDGYGGGHGGGHGGGGHGSSSSNGGGHGRDGYRRPKSWLGELFD